MRRQLQTTSTFTTTVNGNKLDQKTCLDVLNGAYTGSATITIDDCVTFSVAEGKAVAAEVSSTKTAQDAAKKAEKASLSE
jgi:hypothetical protein